MPSHPAAKIKSSSLEEVIFEVGLEKCVRFHCLEIRVYSCSNTY